MPLDHTRLLVERFTDCYRFYHEILGLRPHWGDESGGYASFATEDGRIALALFQRQSMAAELGTGALPPAVPQQDSFMLIFPVDDVDVEVARIRQAGWAIAREPQDFPDWGYRGAYLRDPDGTLVELSSALPPEEWSQGLRSADEKYTA